MAKTTGISEQELYAPVIWQDCTGDYQDIHYHKSDDGLPKSPSPDHKYAMRFVH